MQTTNRDWGEWKRLVSPSPVMVKFKSRGQLEEGTWKTAS